MHIVPRRLLMTGATLLAVCWAQPPTQPPDLPEDRLVMLTAEFDEAPAQNGAGVIVGRGPTRVYVATANHVIRSGPRVAKSVRATFKGLPGETFAARILEHADPVLDLAVLTISDPEALGQKSNPRILGESVSLRRGDKVWAMGYPQGRPWYSRPTPDAVQRNEVDSIRFDSPFIAAGYSGGGLFNGGGLLVGLIKQDSPPEGVAIPFDRVIAKLKEWNYPIELESPAKRDHLVVRLVRIRVKEDGSSGATSWNFRATVNGHTLFDWREKSFNDDPGLNVYTPLPGETKPVEVAAGQPIHLLIHGGHSHGQPIPVSKDTGLAPGAELEVPVSAAKSRDGDFVFIFAVTTK